MRNGELYKIFKPMVGRVKSGVREIESIIAAGLGIEKIAVFLYIIRTVAN